MLNKLKKETLHTMSETEFKLNAKSQKLVMSI